MIEMDPLAPYARWLNKKLVVLDQSLGKIENGTLFHALPPTIRPLRLIKSTFV